MRGTKVLARLATLVLVGAALTGFSPMAIQRDNSNAVYGMYVNGQEVGSVKFAARGLNIYDKALENIEAEFKEEVFIEGEVFFREKAFGNSTPDTDKVLLDGIRKSVDIKTDAYAIIIDGKAACYVRTEDEANQVVDAIKKPYVDTIGSLENHKLEDVVIKQDITLNKERIFYAQLVDTKRAVEVITVGEEGAREYTVKEGDSLWAIARAFDMRVADIQAANPDLKGEDLSLGQTLNIMAAQSLVTIETKEKFTYTEAIPFTKETKDDKNIYVGESKTVQEGKNGEKKIEVNITRENGKEISREAISETVTKEPLPQIIANGTKKRPAPTRTPSRSSGSFKRPGDLTPLTKNGVSMTPWATVNTIFTRGSIAKVTHLDTGLTFYVYRHGGSNHADSEPLTAADTAIMKRIYGSWSWTRESIIVETNGKKFAASMNGMPHGQYTIKNKNFNGHFCIHFLNSRTHGTNRVDPEHQAAIRRVMN